MEKVASIVGTPGMCSDDGRAITYFYRTYLNDHGGAGFSRESMSFDTEEQARAHCEKLGYRVRSCAIT